MIEADLSGAGAGDADLWQPEEDPPETDAAPTAGAAGGGDANADTPQTEEKAPAALETFEKAGKVILNSEVLALYAQS